MSGKIESRLSELGVTLPIAAAPAANYVPFVVANDLVFLSGQLPMKDGALQCQGTLGCEVSVEEGYRAARLCAINLIAHIRTAAGGDLDRVLRIVRLCGFVAATPDFSGYPKVINGASDLLVDVFGDAGRHARSAVGAPSLPLGAAVEIEAVVQLAQR